MKAHSSCRPELQSFLLERPLMILEACMASAQKSIANFHPHAPALSIHRSIHRRPRGLERPLAVSKASQMPNLRLCPHVQETDCANGDLEHQRGDKLQYPLPMSEYALELDFRSLHLVGAMRWTGCRYQLRSVVGLGRPVAVSEA
jgi:hypothetical protein